MMDDLRRIPRDVARRPRYYVYAYVNPVDGRIFYVGKGKGQRALAHVQDTSRRNKAIGGNRKQPDIHILAHGLKDEETALRIESAVIDALGLPSLAKSRARLADD